MPHDNVLIRLAETAAKPAGIPQFSESSLATQFVETHADSLRYVADWNRWLQWDGCSWHTDNTILAFDLAHDICRTAAAACNKPSIAKSVAAAKTVAAVVTLARADRHVASTADQWDFDIDMLNTPKES